MIGQKISTKKVLSRHWTGTRSIVQQEKKDKAVSFLENGSEKIPEQFAVKRDKPNTKLVLVSWEPFFNKADKQNVYEIDSFNKFNFSQWQKNLDTLIDV